MPINDLFRPHDHIRPVVSVMVIQVVFWPRSLANKWPVSASRSYPFVNLFNYLFLHLNTRQLHGLSVLPVCTTKLQAFETKTV